MSSILKALKKLENEKTSRLPDSLRIDSDILKSTDFTRKRSPIVSVELILLVFGGGATATYLFMKEAKSSLPVTSQLPAPAIQKAQSPPTPLIKTETLPAEIIVVPSPTETATKTPVARQQKIKVSESIEIKTPKTVGAGISKKAKEPEEEARTTVATTPLLRVNGIAYQNNSADSLAIVNGIAVSNGSTVEGVVVEEVRKDRVLFQRNGEKFEILMGQSNQ
jgi:general secretion pathway protein B